MGMFDEICCKVALPDGHDTVGVWFQTKSIPDASLSRYTITVGGRLHDGWGNDCEPDGYINFYTVDEAPAAPTAVEPDTGWREYRARSARDNCIPSSA